MPGVKAATSVTKDCVPFCIAIVLLINSFPVISVTLKSAEVASLLLIVVLKVFAAGSGYNCERTHILIRHW
jgi:hypothetical protein